LCDDLGEEDGEEIKIGVELHYYVYINQRVGLFYSAAQQQEILFALLLDQ
jgi:hypothetical protein